MTINFNSSKVSAKIKTHMTGKMQFALDNQVLKDSNYYCPMDTGNLMSSGIRATQSGSGTVAWDTPYARKMYYSADGRISHDSNPNARAKWFEEAKKSHKKEWLEMLQRMM